MIRTQPHKQTDPMKKPGQIVNDVTLGDYIKRKTEAIEAPKKLTFEEWYEKQGYKETLSGYAKRAFANCWKAAQENV